MSLAAVALQLILSLLLVGALAYGVRLERRLRELRDSQAHFTGAVQDLDRAAGRAEAGLASLRASTEQAQVELADHIDAARALVARLDAAGSEAALTLKRLEAAARTPPPAPRPEPRPAPAEVKLPPRVDAELFALAERAEPRQRTPEPAPAPAPVATAPTDTGARLRRVAELLSTAEPPRAAKGRR